MSHSPSRVAGWLMNFDIIARITWSERFRQFFCWHDFTDTSPYRDPGEEYRCEQCDFHYVTKLAEY